MKKIISVLLACAMVFSLSLTVFAADSPSADLGYNVDGVTSEDAEIDYVSSDDEAYSAVDELLDGTTTLPAVDGYTLIALVDIESSASSVTLSISSDIAAITADSDIIVMHYTDGAWTQETATAGDGTITITASSFSPFAIYLKTESTEETTTSSSDDESPETSDTNLMLYVTIAALIAAAGATLAARKIRG